MTAQTDLALERAGFAVSQHNNGKHWVLKGRGIHADYWPTVGKFQVFGKVFRATPEEFVACAKLGKFHKPESKSLCKRCSALIYWTKSNRDRWVPLDPDGGPHLARCKRTQ